MIIDAYIDAYKERDTMKKLFSLMILVSFTCFNQAFSMRNDWDSTPPSMGGPTGQEGVYVFEWNPPAEYIGMGVEKVEEEVEKKPIERCRKEKEQLRRLKKKKMRLRKLMTEYMRLEKKETIKEMKETYKEEIEEMKTQLNKLEQKIMRKQRLIDIAEEQD